MLQIYFYLSALLAVCLSQISCCTASVSDAHTVTMLQLVHKEEKKKS